MENDSNCAPSINDEFLIYIKNNNNNFNLNNNDSNNEKINKNDNNNNNNGVHDIPFLPSNHNMRNTNIKINIKKNKKRNRKLKKKNDESDHSQTLTYENQNKLNYQNNLKNQRFLIVNTNNEFINNLNLFANNIVIYHNCFICNKTFSLQKLYNAECYKHFTCRRCTKNYFEEKIEEGEREFFCPVFKCRSPFSSEILKDIISKNYYKLLTEKTNNEDKKTNDKLNTNTILSTNNNKNFYEKINVFNSNKETLKKYIHKHVLDINTNENFYVFNKQKNQFCPNCYENTLFGKNGTHFIKCLNCFYRICKYCQKSFDDTHMDLNNENHCKVYFRREEELEEEMTLGIKILLEIFLAISSFIIIIFGGFLHINHFFKKIFCYKKIRNNCVKIFLEIIIFLFTILFFLPYLAIIFFILPYFPVLVTIFN